MFVCTQCGKKRADAERIPGRFLCKPCKYAYVRRYRWANRTKVRAVEAAYRQAHRDQISQYRRVYKDENVAHHLVKYAQHRAREKGVPFALTKEDILPLPTHCPVLGIELRVGIGCPRPHSFSLDRLVAERGYVPGNVRVISNRANTIKNNATVEELERVLAYVRSAELRPF